jgi:hypothetical protein
VDTADMAPHTVVMATGVTATPATKCALALGLLDIL